MLIINYSRDIKANRNRKKLIFINFYTGSDLKRPLNYKKMYIFSLRERKLAIPGTETTSVLGI